MSSDRHGAGNGLQVAPYAGRSLRVKVNHHRAAARELVRDGEADGKGGLSSATLL